MYKGVAVKFLIFFFTSFFFLIHGAETLPTQSFYALPRTFSVFLKSMPGSYNDQSMLNTLSKIRFEHEFDQRCTSFLLSFFGDIKMQWQFAQERMSFDNEYHDRFMWGAIIALKLLIASGVFYFFYQQQEKAFNLERFALDVKDAYVADRLQQCFSIPITLFGFFAVYRVIASTLAIKRYSKMVTGKIKSWLTNNAEEVPEELASWYKIVASYDEKTLEQHINSGAFAISLWSALSAVSLGEK